MTNFRASKACQFSDYLVNLRLESVSYKENRLSFSFSKLSKILTYNFLVIFFPTQISIERMKKSVFFSLI